MWVCWDAPPGSCLRPAHHGPTGLLPVPMLATVGATASPGPVPRDGPAGPSDPSTPHRLNQKHLLRRLQFPTGRDRARHCDQCLIVTFQAQDDQTPTMCRPPARACLRPQRRENCAGMNTRHDMRIRGGDRFDTLRMAAVPSPLIRSSTSLFRRYHNAFGRVHILFGCSASPWPISSAGFELRPKLLVHGSRTSLGSCLFHGGSDRFNLSLPDLSWPR
jgi:hypothetical protein